MAPIQWIVFMLIVLIVSANRQSSVKLQLRQLTQNDEQQQRRKQNEEAFKNLRQGLNNWGQQSKKRRFGRQNSADEMVNQLNQRANAHFDEQKQKGPQIDQDQLLKEAGYIEQEVIHEHLQSNKSQSTNNNLPDLQLSFYVLVSILIAIYMLKCIKQRCFQRKASINVTHEESQSLSQL